MNGDQGDLLDLLPRPGDPGERVRAICDLIAGDPLHARDRTRVVAAILEDGLAHGGQVNPNRVRAALTNEHGLIVHPPVIGACYGAMTRTGHLRFCEWVISDDLSGGNAGKPARSYELTKAGAA